MPADQSHAEPTTPALLDAAVSAVRTLGIEVAGPKLFRVIRHEYPEKTVELHFFLCDVFSGTPEPHGCEALVWVGPQEIGSYEFPPADRPVVDALMRGDSGV